jgi:hypothetical protein
MTEFATQSGGFKQRSYYRKRPRPASGIRPSTSAVGRHVGLPVDTADPEAQGHSTSEIVPALR